MEKNFLNKTYFSELLNTCVVFCNPHFTVGLLGGDCTVDLFIVCTETQIRLDWINSPEIKSSFEAFVACKF